MPPTTRPLRLLRRKRLVSIATLSKQTGLSTKTIVEIELGRQRPHYGTIRKICDALGLDPMQVDEFRAAIEEKG